MRVLILLSVFGIVTFLSVSCCLAPRPDHGSECLTHGYNSLFVAKFDRDKPCSTPAPLPASLQYPYGPPGANLTWSGPEGTIHVVDSAALGSRALKITRGGMDEPTVVEAVAGKIDGVPNDAGIYDVSFKAHGEVVPDYSIAGTGIYVRSPEDRLALYLKLFEGSYHLWEDGSWDRLSGTYDPSMAHSVHIKLNLDRGRFSICVNDEVLVSNKAFLDDDFATLHSLVFIGCQTVTEAIPMEFVVDEIRIIK